MEIKIIIQPPYALLVGVEAINSYDQSDNIVIDGIAIHLLFISFEVRWV